VMPIKLSNFNFFILQRSLRFRFAAITHAGDFLVPRLGRAPCFHGPQGKFVGTPRIFAATLHGRVGGEKQPWIGKPRQDLKN
jgi:hypothetical protein